MGNQESRGIQLIETRSPCTLLTSVHACKFQFQKETITMSDLSNTAMLASLSIHQWSAKKYDKKVSQEVAANHGMRDSSLGRYNKSLIAKKALDKISKIAGAARTEF